MGYRDGSSQYCAYFVPRGLDPFGAWVFPWDPRASWDPVDTLNLWTGNDAVAYGGGVSGSLTGFVPLTPSLVGWGLKLEGTSQIVLERGFRLYPCDTVAVTVLVGAGVNFSVSLGFTGTGFLDVPSSQPGTFTGFEIWIPLEPIVEGSGDITYDGLICPQNASGVTVTIPRFGIGAGGGGAFRVGTTCTGCGWSPITRAEQIYHCIQTFMMSVQSRLLGAGDVSGPQ
jgi:hypothetical protein